VKLLWSVLIVTGLLVMVGSGAFAQRYTPPSGTETSTPVKEEPVSGTHPDPFGLTLAASGAAAAVGYVMRKRRNAT
jgi:hypothetical protein